MRERINRLARGIVEGESPVLQIEPQSVKDSVPAGAVTKKELYISDEQGRFIKGLIYSSNMRVRLCDSAFGGSRNRILYEVDGRHLSGEDVITGNFCLVTNSGERKVPYSFSVNLGGTGKTLDSLKTPADFAALAKRDSDLSLRLFEYQDFVEAPFMQDLHTRALYDGLRGRLNRQNQLEEFLVALGAKKPVALTVSTEPRFYENVEENCPDQLEVKAETWGYVQFEAAVEGDFLELPKKSFSSQDFQNGICLVPYQINAGRLHQGKNLGAVRIMTVRDTIVVPVEAQAAEDSRDRERQELQKKKQQYLRLRLQYETEKQQDLVSQMRLILEDIRRIQGEDLENILRLAELCILEGQTERAAEMLESWKDDPGLRGRDNRETLCFYQYLLYLVQKREEQRTSLLERVRQCLEEQPDHAELYLLRLRLESEEGAGPAACLEEMRTMFQHGCHSPFLYAESFRIYRDNPVLLGRMGEYEVQVMMFAARQDLVSRELAVFIAEPAAASKYYRRLYCRLLKLLYQKYEEKELLGAVCSMLIKGDCRGEEYFPWYQKALEQGVSLTRLYEYFLFSLPYDYPYLLPREVLLYFSYEKSMDDASRAILYMNIIRYMNPGSSLYRQYERDIEQFTMEQLLDSRLDQRLSVLYEHMLYREMIDEKVAEILPAILKSYRIRISVPGIRYVIVCYEEIEGEDAFPVRDGIAYVPLFGRNPVILFQDEYGNRYANISCQKIPAMRRKDAEELEEQCYDIAPSHPMLRLQECSRLAETGISGPEDMMTLKRALSDLRLHPLFRRKILIEMIGWYRKRLESDEPDTGDDVDYLMDLELERLEREDRAGVCETLIQQGYMREAFEIVKAYGYEELKSSRLMKLCSRMILQQLPESDPLLLQIAFRLFSEGRYDSVILDYLCEYFNGSAMQMFKVLSQGEREHIETYDLPERLLAQMMFTGETDRIDWVFSWYMSGKHTSDSVIKAYFTMKSADYFLRDKATGDKVFAWLESAVSSVEDKSRIPTIYLLALIRYYSTLKELDEHRQELCRAMLDILLEEKRVFACFQDLGRLMPLPEQLKNQVILEFRGGREYRPELEVRILPEEEEFQADELIKVYPGIYARQKVLFEGEILEYRIYQRDGENRKLVKEGSISCAAEYSREEESRFAALNEMSLCLSLKEETALQEKMKKYVTDSALMEELFGLI